MYRFQAKSLFILITSLMAVSLASAADSSCQAKGQGKPLLELYTSEGCSSCPPADRWLAKHAANSQRSFIPLAFHVDYWDYIGWADRFAQPAFAQRQRERVAAIGDSRVYTPQVMLGEDVHIRWYGAQADLADKASQSPQFALRAMPGQNVIDLSLGVAWADATAAKPVWVALYSDGIVSQVGAGENSGRKLSHDRVVRQLLGPFAPGDDQRISQKLSIKIPDEPGKLGIVAFEAGQRPGQAPGMAFELAIDNCAKAAL